MWKEVNLSGERRVHGDDRFRRRTCIFAVIAPAAKHCRSHNQRIVFFIVTFHWHPGTVENELGRDKDYSINPFLSVYLFFNVQYLSNPEFFKFFAKKNYPL